MWAHDALAVLPRDVEARQVSAHAAFIGWFGTSLWRVIMFLLLA